MHLGWTLYRYYKPEVRNCAAVVVDFSDKFGRIISTEI